MGVEHFDLESKTGSRGSLPQRAHRQNRGTFNCLFAVSLVLFTGFFVLILINFRMGGQEVVVEVQSLQASAHDSLADEEETCEEENLCLTKECVLTSARMLSFMDDTTNPCEDFYKFACANYPKVKAVRLGEDIYDPQAEAMDNMDINIKRFMDDAKANTESTSFNAMKTLYDSCMDNNKRDDNSSTTLKRFLEDHGLSWPIFDEEIEQEASWTSFVKDMETYGIHTLFHPFIFAVDHDMTSVVLRCSMPMLPVRIYLNSNEEGPSEKIYFYKNVILLFLHHMGIRRSEGKKIFEDIMKIETELASTFTGENVIGDECNQPCSKSWCPPCKAKSSEELYPLSPEHEQQLKELYADLLHKPVETIDLRTDCSGNLEEMLRILNAASKKTLMNYLGWRAISHLMPFMSKEYQSLYNHYAGRMMIVDTIPATKWRECTQFIRNNMGVIIAKALVEKHYIKQDQFTEINKRFLDVKDSFGYLIHDVPWLDNNTAGWFIEKLNTMTLQIGYPLAVNEPGVLDTAYKDLSFNPNDTYFENAMKLRTLQVRASYTDQLQNFGANDISLRLLHPLDTSAKYDYRKNVVVFGLGNLMSPLMKYGPGMPKYLEYGQDVILAHQVSHAFDTTGITYDGRGTQIKVEQLPEIVRQKFYAFVACLSRQHATSSSPHDPSDATVINNDIADLGSVYITATGLEHSIKLDHGHDKGHLPGLPYTKRQLFFLQGSQTFCELREKYSMRYHPPSVRTRKERVNSVVRNMVNFGDIFKCAVGTKMNPSSKCHLLI